MTGVAALAICAAFTSCSKSGDELYNPEAVSQMSKEKITETYNARFLAYVGGSIAPDQDWGFGSVNTRAGGTRAAGADTDGEFWARFDPQYKATYNYDVPAPLTSAQKDKVRRYFQQNQYPGGTNAEAMSEYFVQHVYTGGTSMEGSLTLEKYWSSNVQLVQSSSHMDRLVVGSMRFHTNNFNATNATAINVWDGKTYQDGYTPTGTEDNPTQMVEDYNHHKNHTDQIMLMKEVDTQMFGWYQSDGSLEIVDHYRLVSGDVIQAWDNSTVASNGESADVSGMMFVGFDYEGNLSKAQRTFDQNSGKYIWGGEANMAAFREATASDPADSKAYFQGHTGANDKEYVLGCADGYFSDWIIRITKAVKKDTPTPPTPPTRNYFIRVLGEDLTFANSASGVAVTESDEGADFDFNDVVFDVAHVSGGTTDENGTWIRLMAAGGTLPLYIGSVAEANEVHNMFRVSQTTMVNTGHNAHKAKDPVEFRYSADQVNAKDIAIIVIKDGIQFELSAQKGEPASKIAVSNMNFDWADERQSIKKKYPLFVDWAQGGQKISDWWD